MMKKHLSGTQKPQCGNLHPDEAALAWKEGRKEGRNAGVKQIRMKMKQNCLISAATSFTVRLLQMK